MYTMDDREKLNKELSKQLTKEAKNNTKTTKANCDAFGIGRHLIAYHPNLWKKKNWNKDYAKVKFKPEVEVSILYSVLIKGCMPLAYNLFISYIDTQLIHMVLS